jgi:hypothetical protein
MIAIIRELRQSPLLWLLFAVPPLASIAMTLYLMPPLATG